MIPRPSCQTRSIRPTAYGERWLDAYAVSLKPRTVELYLHLLRRHPLPALGALPLKLINKERVRQLFAEKIAAGMNRPTALRVVGLLREILNHAVDDGHIPANPATRLGRFYRGRTQPEATPSNCP